jgi:hypothetical protein
LNSNLKFETHSSKKFQFNFIFLNNYFIPILRLAMVLKQHA